MPVILYSFNKKGYEARFWSQEIAAASDERFRFIPFNHDPYLDVSSYIRAQLLDNLYYQKDSRLLRMYADMEAVVAANRVDAMIVDTCPPYHPDYLRRLPLYKVLRIADGPMSAYDRDFAYVHAYDMVLYHSPAYSADLDMASKLQYLRVPRAHFWPLAVFDGMHDATKTERTILTAERPLDIVFVGAMFPGKMPLLAQVKKAFGRRCQLYGLTNWKRNAYFNVKFGFPGWVRPLAGDAFAPLYQRAKIGINVHNRGVFTVGNYRLFELPANGVMQLSDGGDYLNAFFRDGEEIVGYENGDDLVDRLRYYLAHDDERSRIALNGYRRAMRDHRIKDRLHDAGRLIEEALDQRRTATA